MIETGIFSILPPLLAITLALITKEVYSSLFIGVFSGMVIYSVFAGEGPIAVITHIFDMMSNKIADNAYMIIFLAMLWGVVVLVSKSGGIEAYGSIAQRRFKNRTAVKVATSVIGILIFIDDGFNCLTVGTVMRPIYDRMKISREKLAYIIDSTAAPVCIIAPVSSWAVAVASELDEGNGFMVFLQTIPYNLYAILTLVMVFFISVTGKDFGPMKKIEDQIQKAGNTASEKKEEKTSSANGTASDVIVPILVLIICAILGMAYVGGFFNGVPFTQAIGENPVAGLTLGAFAGLVTAFIMYIPRKLMTPREYVENIVSGISEIVSPMLILVFSWCLGGVCREMIGTGLFISGFVNGIHLPMSFLPFLIFIVAALMSFSMGTAWGTFGILIPIVSMICTSDPDILVPALAATLAGSVYGDHCSPVSDTTILAATGAQCNHISHVETQFPYATLVAIVCAIGYLISGFMRSPWLSIIVCIVILIATITFLNRRDTAV